jgi:hypothetical protein
MKKVRDLPDGFSIEQTQTPEYQEHLRACVAEPGQVQLANSFLEGKKDDGFALIELDYQILASCDKSIPANLDEKNSIHEEGEDVCFSYGILTSRGLISWKLQSGKVRSWLVAELTDSGKRVVAAKGV